MSEYKSKTRTDPNADMGAFHDFIQKSLHVDVSKNQLMDKIRRLKKKYQNNAEKGEDPVFSKPHEHKSFQLSKKIWGSSEANDSIINNNNGTSISKKKAKQRQSSSCNKNTNDIDSKVENIVANIKPITLGLPRQDARTKKQHQVVVGGGPKESGEAEKVEVDGEEEKGDLDEFWSDYPYVIQSLEIEKPFALPDFLKRMLRERMPAIGRDKAKEMNNKWRNLRLEETELFLKKHELVQEEAKFVLDAIKSSSSQGSLTNFLIVDLSQVSFISKPILHNSLTHLLLTCWSASVGQQIIGTPAKMLSIVEFHPPWVKNPPMAGWARTISCGAHVTMHPLPLVPSSSSIGTRPAPSSSPMIMSGRITHKKRLPLLTKPWQN